MPPEPRLGVQLRCFIGEDGVNEVLAGMRLQQLFEAAAHLLHGVKRAQGAEPHLNGVTYVHNGDALMVVRLGEGIGEGAAA